MRSVTAKTKRLILRPLRLSDFKVWQTFCLEQQEPRNEWDKKYRMFKKASRTEYIKKIKKEGLQAKKDSMYSFGVFVKSGELIGEICIMHIQRGAFQIGMLGSVLSNKYWSAGYGKESLSKMIELGFKQFKLHKLYGLVELRNIRSIRMVRSVGMKREGLCRKHVFIADKWMDSILYACTCENFGIKWKANKIRWK